MDVFIARSDGESLATSGRNQVDLAGVSAFVFTLGITLSVAIGIGVGAVGFLGGRLALGEEGDPAAVGRPFGLGVVAGLG